MPALRVWLYQHIQTKHGFKRFWTQHPHGRIQSVGAPPVKQQNTITVARRQIQIMEDHQHRRAPICESPNSLQGRVLVQGIPALT